MLPKMLTGCHGERTVQRLQMHAEHSVSIASLGQKNFGNTVSPQFGLISPTVLSGRCHRVRSPNLRR
jgi:hypothetical protein